MHNLNIYSARTANKNMLSLITTLTALLIIGVIPMLAAGTTPKLKTPINKPLVLEINMLDVEAVTNSRLKDTLSVSIFETTSGDKYVMNTTTGSISIPLYADKHYFIYMSKSGALTQSIEFHTTGSQNSESRTFFVDYEPEELQDGVNDGTDVPMSVVRFSSDIHSNVEIDQLGINVFHD
ncbi:MAG: hypothetical protein JKX73_04740 [Flavobacteriales bacterium]|nr:hypothetical protein [Flavobacteriales bacterium]